MRSPRRKWAAPPDGAAAFPGPRWKLKKGGNRTLRRWARGGYFWKCRSEYDSKHDLAVPAKSCFTPSLPR